MSRVGAFIAAVISVAPAAAQTAYFAAIPDVPVAPGLTESPDPAPPRYDAEHARLVFASAQGAASAAGVRDFYHESLSALGWGLEPDAEQLVFMRGRERLFLRISETNGETLLRVRLVVNNAVTTAD
ncbi:MAG: hypothetical protein AB7T59_07370 [Hyphomonadaceae bacterium]